MKRINCRKCQHFYITWDENFPYGCRAYDFKVRHGLPSIAVYQSSGIECQLFKEKPLKKS